MIRYLFFVLTVLFCCPVLSAQQFLSISGKVNDSLMEGFPGAQVLLMKDTVLLRTGITDVEGKFEIEHVVEGQYKVRIAAMGFVPYDTSIQVGESSLSLPPILLKSQAGSLEEVQIQARKPLIEVRADKIVVNVENSIISSGTSVMDVLQKAPGVVIDHNDNIILKGKPGVVIWIDDKPAPMQGADLAAILRGMPAGSVDKIELIANPGARFDAAGTAGIINIKTRKGKGFGFNGTATLSYGQGKYPKYGAGVNLNYRNRKYNVYVNYNYAYRYWFNHLVLNRKFLDTAAAHRDKQLFRYQQDNYSLFDFRNHIAQLGVDYNLSPKTVMGISFSGSTNNFDPQADNASQARNGNDDLVYNFNTTGRHKNAYANYAANVNLRHTFDSSGRMLTADIDYAAFGSRSHQDFVTQYRAPDRKVFQPDYFLKSRLEGNTVIQSFKTDYNHPFSLNAKLEAGLKSSLALADNEPLFYEKKNGNYELDVKRSNHFIYKEHINAAYANLSKNWTQFSIQAGVRLENTNAKWEQKTTQEKYDTSYTQLFPNIAFLYHFLPQHDIGLSLSRRIERPGYQQLNPFKYFIDKTTYKEGDPYLQPASFYSMELTHTFNHRFVTSFTYGVNKGVITEVIQPSDTEDSVTVQTNKNLDQMTFAGLSGSYSFQIARWWENVSNFNFYYALYQGKVAGTALKAGLPTLDFNTTNLFSLPGNISLELTLFYQTRQLYGYMNIEPLWMLHAGVQKHLWNKKATIKLNIQDLFFTGYPRATSTYLGYQEYFVAERETRVANLSFIYRFGKNTVAPVPKRGGGAEEEKNRANSANS